MMRKRQSSNCSGSSMSEAEPTLPEVVIKNGSLLAPKLPNSNYPSVLETVGKNQNVDVENLLDNREESSGMLLIKACRDLKYTHEVVEYVKLILSKGASVRCADEDGNTALHYAAAAGSYEIVTILLEAGSYIGHKNKNGISPVENISAECMSRHLDNCLKSSKGDTCKEFKHRRIDFDYRSLLPPHGREVQDDRIDKNFLEMQVLLDIARSKPHRHLMKHPILSSFLSLKWKRTWPISCAIFIVYVLFYLQIITHISCGPIASMNYTNARNKTTSSDGKLDERIVSLTGTLWTSTFKANLTIGERSNNSAVDDKILLVAHTRWNFTARINVNEESGETKPKPYNRSNANGTTCWIANWLQSDSLLIITIISLLIRVTVPLFLSPPYFLSPENWLEVLVISLQLILISGIEPRIDALVILLSAFQLINLMGRHPRISILIETLKIITANFSRLLLLYSILIIPFALAFYTVFENGNKNNFRDLGSSLLNTIVILIGQFDASKIPYSADPTLSHILLMISVFLITTILLNVLIALANSDTQVIIVEGEIRGLIARTKLLFYIEDVIVGSSFRRNRLRLLSKRFLFLPKFLPKYGISVMPFRSNTVICCGREDDLRSKLTLDESIIKEAGDIISARRDDYDSMKTIADKVNRGFENQSTIMNEIFRAARESGAAKQEELVKLLNENLNQRKALRVMHLDAKISSDKWRKEIVDLMNKNFAKQEELYSLSLAIDENCKKRKKKIFDLLNERVIANSDLVNALNLQAVE